MVEAHEFLDRLTENGFGPYIGVPCSFLKPFINYVIDCPKLEYLAANNEGEAIAIAAGAYLAGQRPVIMFQNAGLGNAINPLTSLTYTFRIPLLLITTWRGQPGLKDEPQHDLMGAITEALLRCVRIECEIFPECSAEILPSIDRAIAHMQTNSLPYALIMKKGSVAPCELHTQPTNEFRCGELIKSSFDCLAPRLTRRDAIAQIVECLPASTALIATTGKTGRELFYCSERPGNLYVVGSMGCASSLGLGVAMYQPNHRVVVLDGDGAALMRLEAMVSIGHYRLGNITHIILDNLVHDSTGGQSTLADTVRFEEIAIACGYATAISLVTPEDLIHAVNRCLATKGPHLVHVRIAPGSEANLGRPTLTPVEIKERFMAFLESGEQLEEYG